MKKSTILVFAAAALTACAAQGGKTATSPEAAATEGRTQAPESPLVGGYTDQRPLDDEDRRLFDKATENLAGVKYTPQTVATQVVAGTNYRFICTAETVTREPKAFRAEVTVFRPLPGQGAPRITQIRQL